MKETWVSEALIIRACNTPGGSGGVMRWNQKVARESVVVLTAKARIGSKLDHMDPTDFYVPGCYKRGFRQHNYGNGVYTQSQIGNVCPHARYVELGRGHSYGHEALSSRFVKGGMKMMTPKHGTSGFSGDGAIYSTVKDVCRANGMRGELHSIIKIAASAL